MMTDQESFEELLPELKAIPADAVRTPEGPIDKAVHDGEVMAAATVQDLERFTTVGLPADIALRLGLATAALRFAEARWQAATAEQQAALAQWKGKLPAGQALRRELLAAQTYAFRKFSTPLAKIRHISLDGSPTDTIQDLTALSELGREHRELLTKINFDLSVLDISAQQAAELDQLYAKAYSSAGAGEARELRDRALSHMRQIMLEISDAAQYVLRNDPARLTVYYSDFRRPQRASALPETALSSPAQ